MPAVRLDEDTGGCHHTDERHEAVDDLTEVLFARVQKIRRTLALGDVGRTVRTESTCPRR